MLVRLVRQRRALLAWGFPALMCLAFLHFYTNITEVLAFFILPGVRPLSLSLLCNKGRLGNQMCSYATLYGLSALNRRRHFSALSCNMRTLTPYFPLLNPSRTIHSSWYLRMNPWQILPYLKPEDESIPPKSNFISGYKYPCSFTFFDHVRDEIREEFRFREDLQHFASSVIEKANVHGLQNVTYVGVHVRRGDYQKRWLDAFEGIPVNFEYFQEAFAYFRNKYTNVVFVAVSDDRLWCIENLSTRFGVYVAEDAPSPAHDMAILAACDHTILTYGTFGFWGAYLAGGEVVYFDKFLKPGTKFTTENFIFEKMYPPQWKGIVTVNASVWTTPKPKEGFGNSNSTLRNIAANSSH